MNTTKELYAQYREAARNRNDVGAHRILKQICELDPSDKEAATQLREVGERLADSLAPELDNLVVSRDTDALRVKMQQLKEWAGDEYLSKQPSYKRAVEYLKAKGKKGGAAAGGARTAQLYKQFREAGLAHQDERAFEILQKIVDMDPADQSAVEQKKATGQRLCAKNRQKLSDYLRNGDMDALPEMVGHFREWGDEAYLNTLPDFPEAARLVDAKAQKEAAQKINGMFFTLQSAKDMPLAERESMASEIEQLAVQHNVSIENDISETIKKIHEEWQAHRYLMAQRDKAEQLKEQLCDIEDACNLHAPLTEAELTQHIESLAAMEEDAMPLCDIEEGKELFDQVQLKKAKLSAELTARHRKRAMIRRVSSLATVSVLGLGGFLIYAHSQADKIAERLEKGMEAKQVPFVKDNLNANAIMHYCCEKFSGYYRVAHKEAKEWMARHDALVAKRDKNLATIQSPSFSVGLSTLQECVKLHVALNDVRSELEQNYGEGFSPEQIRIQQGFLQRIAELQGAAYAKFSMPPADSSLEDLSVLFGEFKASCDIFNFSQEDTNKIYSAFRGRAEQILLHKGEAMTDADIEKSLRLYKQYVGILELPADIQAKLEKLREENKGARTLATSLPNCTSLENYVSLLAKFPMTYEHAKGAFSVEDMGLLLERRQTLAALYVARELGLDSKSLDYEKLLAIRNIFQSSTNVYGSGDRGAIPGYIDKLTLTNDKKAWKKGLSAWRDGDTVYVGIIQTLADGSQSMQSISASGKKYVCPIKVASLPPVRLKLDKKQLENMGFSRLELQKGCVIPAELLVKVANYNRADCPVLLRACLYGLTIEMMEHYSDAIASGIALSPTLQKDIKLYRSTARSHSAEYGSWAHNHSAEDEEAWRIFFNRVAEHDYRSEVIKQVNRVLEVRLEFAGYVDGDGKAHIRSGMGGKQILYANSVITELEPYTENSNAVPFTPLFVLGS